MLSSIYRQLLLVALTSPLTELCVYTTPWSPAANIVRQPNETLSSPEFSRSSSTTIIFEGPPTSALSGSSALAAPVSIPLLLASALTTLSLPAPPRHPHRSVSHHLSPITLDHHFGCYTSAITSGLLQTSVSTAPPLLPQGLRAVLLTHTDLHDPNSSYTYLSPHYSHTSSMAPP
jgi:hypothetical protein